MTAQDPKKSILAIVNQVMQQHPDLAQDIERIAQDVQKKNAFDLDILWALNASLLEKSCSQLRQDMFVLSELGYKRDGFFVEFGATNGFTLSNTHLLEKEFGWTGVLAEPATLWHTDLAKNRTAKIDHRCVWKKSNETLVFNETSYAELSTIDHYSASDLHAKSREDGKRYSVNTITLMDLLEEHGAPREIDYLSIDTEGSEFEILEVFDFNKYDIRVITCEHNFTPMRARIHDLLTRNGFVRKYEALSQFDDWYVKLPAGQAKPVQPVSQAQTTPTRPIWASRLPGIV